MFGLCKLDKPHLSIVLLIKLLGYGELGSKSFEKIGDLLLNRVLVFCSKLFLFELMWVQIPSLYQVKIACFDTKPP